MLYLAVNYEDNVNIGIKKISKELELPTPFLGKILQNLVKEGLLSSTKGPHGGFILKKDPYDINMYDIVKIIDGNKMFYECFLGLKICINNPAHSVDCEFSKSHAVRSDLKALYQNQTLGSFAETIRKSKNKDLKF